MPIVVSKWYAYAKWVLERVEGFPLGLRQPALVITHKFSGSLQIEETAD